MLPIMYEYEYMRIITNQLQFWMDSIRNSSFKHEIT